MKKNTVLIRSLVLGSILCMTMAGVAHAETFEGDANVDQRNYPSTAPFIHPPFYNVKLTVETDENGVITSVADNGTGQAGSVQEGNEEFWEQKNKSFFDVAMGSGILDKFVGMTVDDVKALDMTGADAVSGATMAGAAIQEAVVNALEGKAGKTFLPGEGCLLPVEEVTDSQVILSSLLPEDFDLQVLDVRYGVKNAEEAIVPADAYTAEYADGKLSLSFTDMSSLKPGYYYVNVVDASGTYRSPNFEKGHGEESTAQNAFFVIDSGLAEGDVSFDGSSIVLSSGDIADYMQNIEHVIIQAEGAEEATEQELVGHHGTVNTSFIVLDENGVLNADGVLKNRDGSETALFEEGVNYTVTVAAYGYPELTFEYAK